ncbi:MAG: hypothetical protein IIZ60_01620 [Clostridia bacterium]|nr:hypothetical protein [Clostridia bacterium]
MAMLNTKKTAAEETAAKLEEIWDRGNAEIRSSSLEYLDLLKLVDKFNYECLELGGHFRKAPDVINLLKEKEMDYQRDHGTRFSTN